MQIFCELYFQKSENRISLTQISGSAHKIACDFVSRYINNREGALHADDAI